MFTQFAIIHIWYHCRFCILRRHDSFIPLDESPVKSSFLVAYRSIDCRVSLSCHRGLIHLIGQPAADKTLSWRGSFSIKSSWNKKRLLINDSADEPLLGLIYLPADKYLSRTWSPSPFLRLLFIVLRGTRADMNRLESFGAPSYSNSN